MSLSNLTGVVKISNLQTNLSSKNYPSVKGVGPLTNMTNVSSQMTPARNSNSTGRHDQQSQSSLNPDDIMYIKTKHV